MYTASRSQYISADECARRRWLAYEAPNGTATHGWQRKAHAIPLATGAWVHKGLADIVSRAKDPYTAAYAAADAYRVEATARGLETDWDVTAVIEEQAALIAGLVYGWGVVRWAVLQADWEVISVEREGTVKLADDLAWQYRCDWVGRRRADDAVFVWEFKTVGMADERWMKGWDIDPQPLLNAWAVEQETGERVQGVIIEGLVKGARRKDKDEFGQTTGERQQSALCYGYFNAGSPPLVPETHTHEYKRGRGWQRFAVGSPGHPLPHDWFDALPPETRESFFVSVPPVYRDDARVLRKLRQVVARERQVQAVAEGIRTMIAQGADVEEAGAALDESFPQNEHACLWPTRCPMYDACHTAGVTGPTGFDLSYSGLYIPRTANHPALEGGDD